MDLRQMRYVLAVAEHGAIRGAARALHIAPQSLAEQVGLAERETGAALFDRSRGGVALTPVGEVFVAHATAALTQAEHVLTATRAAAGQVTPAPVRVAVATGLASVAGELFRRLLVLHPEIDVRAADLRTTDQLDALRAGEISAGVAYEPVDRHDARGLAMQPLLLSPVRALLRRDDPLAAGPGVCLPDLAGTPLLLPSRADAAGLRRHLLAAFAAHHLEPRLGPTVHGHELAIASVAAGRGYTLCVLPSAHVAPDLVFLPLHEQVPPVKIVLRTRRADRSPGVTALLQAARSMARPRSGSVAGPQPGRDDQPVSPTTKVRLSE